MNQLIIPVAFLREFIAFLTKNLKSKTMKIREITSQSRRDFTAIYECEHCEYTKKDYGYDDAYFHQNVIPEMKCERCGKKAPVNYRPLATKYPDEMHI